MHTFNIEVTDTFAGEANYCWMRRYTVQARSILGAIQKLSRKDGGQWRKAYDCGDHARYNLKGSAVCAFISYADNQEEQQ